MLPDLVTNLRGSVFKKMPDIYEYFRIQETLCGVEGILIGIGTDSIYLDLFLENIKIY